jgi:hypothetical protein
VTYTKLWADQFGHYILETAERDGLRYGVMVNTNTGAVGDEKPVDSIARFMPYSDFQPLAGELPAEVKELVDAAGAGPDPGR